MNDQNIFKEYVERFNENKYDDLKDELKLKSIILDNNTDCILVHDLNGNFIYVNETTCNFLGYTKEELMKINLHDLDVPEFSQLINPRIEELMEKKELIFQSAHLRKDKSVVSVEVHARIIEFKEKKIIFSIARDITKLKTAEYQLKSSLEEKEVLLREIHHRVKNNMQIISSLLNLQSRYLNDKEAVNILKESQNRVKSMSIVHEELYRSVDLSKIDFAEYIRRLLSGLFSSYGVNSEFIKSNIDVENIFLDIDTAVPCGLIINELVSNSLKYAFLYEKGEISVRFYLKDKKNALIVKDNGIGFPKDVDFKNTNTLGLQLVNTLVEQLCGEIELYGGKGTVFKIIF